MSHLRSRINGPRLVTGRMTHMMNVLDIVDWVARYVQARTHLRQSWSLGGRGGGRGLGGTFDHMDRVARLSLQVSATASSSYG